jgi:hypothetical protein
MTPWQKAKQWHDEHIVTNSFEESLGWHLSLGVVYSTPQLFMLARECHWDGEQIVDGGTANAWLVTLAAAVGCTDFMRRLMDALPHPQAWILWQRRGEIRVRAFDWNKLDKKVRAK